MLVELMYKASLEKTRAVLYIEHSHYFDIEHSTCPMMVMIVYKPCNGIHELWGLEVPTTQPVVFQFRGSFPTQVCTPDVLHPFGTPYL